MQWYQRIVLGVEAVGYQRRVLGVEAVYQRRVLGVECSVSTQSRHRSNPVMSSGIWYEREVFLQQRLLLGVLK